jgi:hypothetical protein
MLLTLFTVDAPCTMSGSYPFRKPTALLSTNSHSKGTRSEEIPMDCDWTAACTLTDVAVHVALKLRQMIQQGAMDTNPPFMLLIHQIQIL